VSPRPSPAKIRFKYRFSRLSPLPAFLLVSTPRPTHAFVTTAILAFTTPSPAITALVEESVLLAMAGAVDCDAMIALYGPWG
jgi:hypothetical protein